jgi:hypothetical protein
MASKSGWVWIPVTCFLLGSVGVGPLAPADAAAQTLAERVGQLFTFGNCGQPLCLDVDQGHGDHYNPEVVQGEQNTLAFLRSAIVSGLTGVPTAAAHAGVRVRFVDGQLRTEDVSPGPIFAERALTLGEGILVFGANTTGLSFSNLRGVPLDDLELNFAHVNVGAPEFGDPEFENDIIRVRTDLSVSLLVTNLYGAYGVTDALDVAVSFPLVRSALSGDSEAQVVSTLSQTPHVFEGGTTSAQTSTDGSAVGIGDISVRAKYRVLEGEQWGAALLGEVRLPTGSSEDFHGTGSLGFSTMGILSGQSGNFSPHLNFGAVFLGSESVSDQFRFALGFDQILTPTVTLAVDLLGSFAIGDEPFALPGDIQFDVPQPRTVRSSNIPQMDDNRLDGSIGAKFALPGETRLVTNALVPLNNGGMRPSFVWTLGIERLF